MASTEFSMRRFAARLAVAATALLPLACSAAEAPKYELGKHYKEVRQPQKLGSDASKITVAEVFSYSCPHCFHFETYLHKWVPKLPADVEFVRQPHTLGSPVGQIRNKAMYTAQMLGVFEPFHKALFGAIHGQGKMMSTADEVRALFVQSTGVKAEDFDGAFSSFAVDSRFRIGENAIREMGIASVPTLVVDGKYYATPSSGGGFDQMLAITDFLVEQARKARSPR